MELHHNFNLSIYLKVMLDMVRNFFILKTNIKIKNEMKRTIFFFFILSKKIQVLFIFVFFVTFNNFKTFKKK